MDQVYQRLRNLTFLNLFNVFQKSFDNVFIVCIPSLMQLYLLPLGNQIRQELILDI